MDLHRVRGNGCQLYFPPNFPKPHYRGREGYVVDLSIPLEREWCEGQMHKLEPAPDATAADEITHPTAIRLMNAAARDTAAKVETSGATAASQPASPAASSSATAVVDAPAATATSTDSLRVDRRGGAKKGDKPAGDTA